MFGRWFRFGPWFPFTQGFGVAPLDAWSFAAAPLLLIPIAVLACLGPALRAASADPATVLRST